MANYIANFISISSSSSHDIAMLKEFVKGNGNPYNPFDFSKIVPIEDEVPDASCARCGVFQKRFWGCSGNSHDHKNNFIPDIVLSRHISMYKGTNTMYLAMYRFDTNWNNCLPVIGALHDLFPNVNIVYFYADEPIATGVGEAFFGNGFICHRKYEDYSKDAFEISAALDMTTPEDEGYVFDTKSETYIREDEE